MGAKHTGATWKVDVELGSRNGEYLIAVDAGDRGRGMAIAETRVGSGNERANARLIAAAPELLEACLKLVEWDDREKDHAISFMARIDLCEEAFTAMRAAIAKATQ